MTDDITTTDYTLPEDPYLVAKRRADETAKLLREVLGRMGVTVGVRDEWPDIKGRATFNGDAYVYLGTVPSASVTKLTDALLRAQLSQNRIPR